MCIVTRQSGTAAALDSGGGGGDNDNQPLVRFTH
jgi:hypothetical protein